MPTKSEVIRKVKVKFLESMAGMCDPTPQELEKKYLKIADEMRRTCDARSIEEGSDSKLSAEAKAARVRDKYGRWFLRSYTDDQIKAAVDLERAKDAAVLGNGIMAPNGRPLAGDWGFRRGDVITMNQNVAELWAENGTVEILGEVHV